MVGAAASTSNDSDNLYIRRETIGNVSVTFGNSGSSGSVSLD